MSNRPDETRCAIQKVWDTIVENAVALRHDLHRQPELTWAERQTAQTLRDILTQHDITWRPCAELGTIATFATNATGPHIALRADIDALPIEEQSGVAWASQINGCMHACGHDGHAATMAATAQWLKQNEAALPSPVSLFFQPAEEGGHGAKKMIEDGALKGIDAIFGWHNWPAIPFGQAVCPEGVVMAANGTFQINVLGRGGHASQPEKCRDPVLAGSAIVMALQQAVSRRLPPQQAVVISVTSFDAPSIDTTILDAAKLGGSFRIADNGLRETVHALITEIAKETAKAYGCTAEVEMRPRYLATVNHAEEAERFRSVLADELGADWQAKDIPLPVMASEDFSYYLAEVPGAYALIGADDGEDHHHPCHSAYYDFNDRLIPLVMRLYARLAGVPVP